MQSQIIKYAATLIFISAGVFVANAQIHSRMSATVPFDFYVDDQRMSAGDYVITNVNPASGQITLAFSKLNGKGTKIVLLIPRELGTIVRTSKVVITFNQYGSEYFLSEIRSEGENFAAETMPSKREKQLIERSIISKKQAIALSRGQRR